MPPSQNRSSRVFNRSIRVLLVGACGWILLNAPWESLQLRLTAAGLILAGIWPITNWIEKHEDSYPLFETLLLMTIPFYLVPLLNEHRALSAYPESVIERAALAVFLFQIAVFCGSRFPAKHRRPPRRSVTIPLLPDDRLQYLSLGLAANTIWLYLSNFTDLIPPTLIGSLRALFFGLGLIGAFTMSRLWAMGHLRGGLRAWVVFNLTFQVGMIIVSLLLIHALLLVAVTLLGYFSAARRIPWLVTAVALVVFTVLHNGKSEMRQKYWDEGQAAPSFTELPAFYREWLETGFMAMEQNEEENALLLFDRASLLQIVAYAVDRIPSQQPHFNGRTYANIPAQLVPRFLWPNKPSPNDSVKMLSVGLGLLSQRAAETTSIGFGMIAEAFVNFGLFGVVILGVMIGAVLQWVALISTATPTFSILGLLRILCLAWCLSAEVTLIVWLSSFYQACIAVFVPLLAWHKFVGGSPNLPTRPPTIHEAAGETAATDPSADADVARPKT